MGDKYVASPNQKNNLANLFYKNYFKKKKKDVIIDMLVF